MIMPQWVIEKKRDGQTLTSDEIRGFVEGFTRGEIADYQVSAFAMAVYFVGMTPDETAVLTDAMLRSGEQLNLARVPGPKVDKHSTGGVGDKISLVLAPLLAACGATVPMMSGRGLGITGGTLDKLEAIPGFQTRLSEEQAIAVLADVGCVMIGPTARVAPADRKLYAIRDVTGTVPSVPLITASILSKKLAEGVEHLVLDVKCGLGAFMRDLPRARELASLLVATARRMGLSCRALVTDMNQPLGRTVGNALEVREAIEVLQGCGPMDVVTLTIELGAELLEMAGVAVDRDEARAQLRAALADGKALERFARLIRAQGGDVGVVDNPDRLPSAPIRLPLVSPTTAWIAGVDAERVGRASVLLGAGRRRAEDKIDPRVGIANLTKVGARVAKGDVLAVIHAAEDARAEEARRLLVGAFTFVDEPPAAMPLILERHG